MGFFQSDFLILFFQAKSVIQYFCPTRLIIICSLDYIFSLPPLVQVFYRLFYRLFLHFYKIDKLLQVFAHYLEIFNAKLSKISNLFNIGLSTVSTAESNKLLLAYASVLACQLLRLLSSKRFWIVVCFN